MSKNTFVKGAAILGVAGIIVKLLGAVFRIPLTGFIGATGMAYYTPAYSLYTVLVVVATSGIPVAISRMVSERITIDDYEEAHRIFKLSFRLMLSIGVVAFAVLFFGANVIAEKIGLPEAKLPMMAVAPALILVPIMAAYRGYFQGMQNMRPTAFSQVFEQVFRVGAGLFLGFALYKGIITIWPKGNHSPEELGATGAAFGGTVGAIAGLSIIFLIYILSRKSIKKRQEKYPSKSHTSSKDIIKEIIVIALPITIGAAVMPIMNFVEVPIITERLLASGWSKEVAENMYGQIGGLAMPIINLPQVLTTALAMSLVPLISSAFKEKNMEKLKYNTSLSIKVSMIVGMPCAVGIAVLAEPILLLLYSSRKEEAIHVASTLAILAIGIIFLSIVQTVTGVLQGVGKQMVPVINLSVGIVIKIVFTWVLVGIPSLNIKGAAIGTAVAYLIVAILDLIATKKYTGAQLNIIDNFIRPAGASVVMGIVAWFTYYIIFGGGEGNKIACLIAVALAGITYVIMLFVTKSITTEDLENLPKGDKLIKVINKFGRK